MKFIEKLKFNDYGLVPVIMQEEGTGRVVMMAWMNGLVEIDHRDG